MDEFTRKALAFTVALQNAYKDEEDRETVQKLELTEDGLTEDFTAMLVAMNVMHKKITNDNQNLIGFTHTLNRLAIQHVMEKK